MKYLILGHPRSGTAYAAKLFRENGIDIGHERMGMDGTSNWQMAVRAPKYPWDQDGVKRQDVEFEIVIHIIRNPLDVINSVAFTEKHQSEQFRSQFIEISGNKFERAIKSYWNWTQLIQSQKPNHTVAVEKLHEFMGFHKSSITNERQHQNLTESELRKEVDDESWKIYEQLKEFYNNL